MITPGKAADLILIRADTVILAVGMKPENQLIGVLKGIVPELYSIGDCISPRDAMAAMRDGAEISRQI
jgi:2-enoate reductase